MDPHGEFWQAVKGCLGPGFAESSGKSCAYSRAEVISLALGSTRNMAKLSLRVQLPKYDGVWSLKQL